MNWKFDLKVGVEGELCSVTPRRGRWDMQTICEELRVPFSNTQPCPIRLEKCVNLRGDYFFIAYAHTACEPIFNPRYPRRPYNKKITDLVRSLRGDHTAVFGSVLFLETDYVPKEWGLHL